MIWGNFKKIETSKLNSSFWKILVDKKMPRGAESGA